MKLLIITQKVDKRDSILGFFHRWLEEFSKYCEKITVICLGKGEYNLPENVKVLSLGKEEGISRLKYLSNFYQYLWQEHKNYDIVFVHMNPIYLVLAGWWWRLTNKKISLWYTHRQVDWKLRLAEKFTQIIFTASRESFRLPSPKLLIVGHGIDTEAYHCQNQVLSRRLERIVLHVGRITPIKNCDVLIKAGQWLSQNLNQPYKIWFVGEAVTVTDFSYQQELVKQGQNLGLGQIIEFKGSVPNSEISEYYCQADLSVNLTPTGGVDKAVLESMAAGVPVLSSNKTFTEYFGKYDKELLFTECHAEELADKIRQLLARPELARTIGHYLREQIIQKASLPKLIEKIILNLRQL